MRLNRKIEYALIALKYMSNKGNEQRTTVKEICSATGVPFDATSRVMQQMGQKNILKAELGAGGGYQLVQDLSKISFLEIVELIMGKIEVVRCVTEQHTCDISTNCNVSTPLRLFNKRLVAFYRDLPVSSLLSIKNSKLKDVSSQELREAP